MTDKLAEFLMDLKTKVRYTIDDPRATQPHARDRSSVLHRAAAYLDAPPAITGHSIETLGWWEETAVEAACLQAEEESGGSPWFAVIERPGKPAETAYVIQRLVDWAEMVAE